jgi:hypothetical protein
MTDVDTRSPDKVRDFVKNLKAKAVELALPLKVVDALNEHEVDFQNSLNLGYYRTSVKCWCGEGWWFGSHVGDPSAEDMWSIHKAEVVAAVLELNNPGPAVSENPFTRSPNNAH